MPFSPLLFHRPVLKCSFTYFTVDRCQFCCLCLGLRDWLVAVVGPLSPRCPVCLGWRGTPEARGLPLSGMSSVPDLVPRLLGCGASSVFGSQSCFLPGILLTSWNVLPAAPGAPPSLSSLSSAVTSGSHFWVFPVFSVAGPLGVQPCVLGPSIRTDLASLYPLGHLPRPLFSLPPKG